MRCLRHNKQVLIVLRKKAKRKVKIKRAQKFRAFGVKMSWRQDSSSELFRSGRSRQDVLLRIIRYHDKKIFEKKTNCSFNM